MQYVGLIKNFTAEGLIEKRRLVTFGIKEGHVARAGVGAKLLGTTAIRGASGADVRVDVCLDGIREIEFGGVVAYGDPLTSDAEGRAIKAEPAGGVTVPVIGTALDVGGVGVIGHVLIRPGHITG